MAESPSGTLKKHDAKKAARTDAPEWTGVRRRLPEEARKLCDRVERAARKGPTSAAGIEGALRRDLALLRRRFECARAERSAGSGPADGQEDS